MVVKLKWNGPEFRRYTDRKIDAFLKAAGTEHLRICQQMASVPNPGVRKKRTRDTSKQGGGRKGSQYTVYPHSSKGAAPPAYGEPPRVRSGFGRKNIVGGYNRPAKAWRTGYTANARYMTFHEIGIRYKRGTQRRATVVPALMLNRDRLTHIGKAAADRIK